MLKAVIVELSTKYVVPVSCLEIDLCNGYNDCSYVAGKKKLATSEIQ